MRVFWAAVRRNLLLTIGLSLFVTPPVLAQEGPFSLVTSPLPILVSTKPGQPVSTDLRVRNAGTETERLRADLFKFSVNDQSEVKLAERQPGDDFMDWVSFSPAIFNVAPNEWRTIKMTINVPATASLGYYYAVGFSRADAPRPTPGGAALEGQVITFVLLDVVVPGAKRELQVSEFSADRSVYEFLPSTLTVKVRNSGNVHVAPTGSIFIKRGGKTVATLSINPNRGNVLPNSTRSFKVEWSDGFPVYVPKSQDGKPINKPDGTPVRELKWDFSKVPSFRLGRYSAKMVLVYDNGQRDVPIEGELGFWVLPWKLMLIVGAVLALAGFGLWSATRNFWRKFSRRRRDS